MKIRKMNLYHSYLIYQINDSLKNVLMNLSVHKNYLFINILIPCRWFITKK